MSLEPEVVAYTSTGVLLHILQAFLTAYFDVVLCKSAFLAREGSNKQFGQEARQRPVAEDLAVCA